MEYFNHDQAFPEVNASYIMPEMAIPTYRKTKEWKKACADVLETIGLKQMRENAHYKDFYRMKDGKMSYMELSSVMPQLKEVQEIREMANIPSFLKHYDLIGTIVNVMTGWLSNMSDQYNVIGTDEEEVNQYLDTKTDLLAKYIGEQMTMTIQKKMLEKGIDPNRTDFSSEEEQQQYQAQVQQMTEAMTPPEIETFMNTRWKTAAAIWGDNTLTNDRFRFYMDELDTANFVDMLLTGKCFRAFNIGYDYYMPENWSPLNTFYSQNVDSKYPQFGDYIGRVHYFSPAQIISRYGGMLTAEEKKAIVGGRSFLFGNNGEEKKRGPGFFSGWWDNEVIPFKNYHDYVSLTNAEDFTGEPMGMMTTWDDEGKEVRRPTFLPRYKNTMTPYWAGAQMLADTPVRPDLYRVTEAYAVSYKQIFCVTYISETGLVSQQIVTDELMQQFLTDNGIKKIHRTMTEGVAKPEVNTYFVDYVPEVRRFIKISGVGLKDGAIYLDGEPIKHQVKGGGNTYGFILPVSGYVGESLAQRIAPFQMEYNLACNQLYNLMEKEIGVFFLTDITFLPKEYKDWGSLEDTFSGLMDVAKATGALPIDASRQNAASGSPFNQFSVYDLSLTNQMSSRMQIAEWAKNKAFEIIGITPQSLGQQGQYETAEGVKQGASSTQIQTQRIYDEFENFKKRTLDMHLSVAQACQKEGKDIQIMVSRDDLSKAFIQLSDDDITLRDLGVQAITNSKKRKELEMMKQYLIQMNTAGSNMMDLAGIVTSDSFTELMTVARKAVKYQEQIRAQEQQSNQQIAQQQSQAEQQKLELEHQYKMEEIKLQGEMNIRRESVLAAGRAADSNADSASLNFVKDMTNANLQDAQNQKTNELKSQEMELRNKMADDNFQLKMRELNMKAEQLRQRQKEDDTKRYTSEINKN